MGLIEDISRFLETRLEEYIRKNPQMELQVLLEQLKQQEAEILRIILDFEKKEKQFQDQILAIAEDIKLWHERASKAKESGRQDLANAANEREASLLKQGNQVWGQMELTKQRLAQTLELRTQIKDRIKEVQLKIDQIPKSRPASGSSESKSTFSWETLNPPPSSGADDPLEAQFQKWEMDEEIERLKRKMR
ncbi:hypothetical protein Syn7502_01047 [Synechococcus sp. PCC 7502]|uniref:TIGR04376 family protein n=1 Tax=Synechococcus sp. PCC 7502 TaxID=1173263 RepID=UPI00029FBF2E|nr:TIGR04376 family protein [Synechococcus sp. PCC 7502]AFY73157.1 hypothetical protein Syn7502_01047 [Synechococcus sp. PCC 7502]